MCVSNCANLEKLSDSLQATGAVPLPIKEKMSRFRAAAAGISDMGELKKQLELQKFTQDDMRGFSGHMKTALKQTSDAASLASQKWNDTTEKEQRTGKRDSQRSMLIAYMLDPSFGKVFQTITESVTTEKGWKQSERWVPWMKISKYRSEDEVCELISTGQILERSNPKVPSLMECAAHSTS